MATSPGRSRLLYNKFTNPVNIIYFSGFLDLFGVSMIMPLILPYARELGASPTVAGLLGSVYGGIQLFSSPILGQWSDTAGRHWVLWVCLVVSGVGYFFVGLAASIPMLVLARIVLGSFKHSQNVSRTYLSELVPDKERSAVLGHFNAASSIGFILGPVVGGHVAELDAGFFYVACVCGAIFLANSALVWYLLPATPSTQNAPGDGDINKSHGDIKKSSSSNLERDTSTASLQKMASEEINFSPKNLIRSFRSVDWPDLWDLFLIKFLAGFSVILFRSNHNMIVRQKFAATPTTVGYMMSYSGIVSALFGFGVGKVTSLFSSSAQAFQYSLMLQAFTLTLLTFASSMTLVFIALTPLSLVTTIQRVVATDLTIRRGGKRGRGGLMGLSQSVMSLARMLSPFIAGLAQEVDVDGPSKVAVLTTVCAVALMLARPQDPEHRKKWKKD